MKTATCKGCKRDGFMELSWCKDEEWCEVRRCGIEKNLNGCYECKPVECRKGLYSEKIKPRAFAEFVRRYGVEELLDCLERNERAGIIYHREGIMGDYEALYLVLAGPDNMQHYPYAFDEIKVRDWIKRNTERYSKEGFGLWAVCLKDTGEMIGDCGLTLQNIEGKTLPEIGYHIRRDCQRMGYAKEAARAVMDWAFRNTDYQALYSYCKYTNEASIKTAEAIGMQFDREYPDEANGITHVSVIYRRT